MTAYDNWDNATLEREYRERCAAWTVALRYNLKNELFVHELDALEYEIHHRSGMEHLYDLREQAEIPF